MYTHKRFFIAAGLSGLWYGAIELAGYLGWYWLVVVLLALPCVLCFGLWMRLEDERDSTDASWNNGFDRGVEWGRAEMRIKYGYPEDVDFYGEESK